MNPNAQFERDLEQWLQSEAPASAPAGLHAAVIERARTMRQGPSWLVSLRGGTVPSPTLTIPRLGVRMAYLLVVLGLVLALIAGAILAGVFVLRQPI